MGSQTDGTARRPTVMSALAEKTAQLREVVEGWAGAFLVPSLLYLASRVVLSWSAERHWLLGAVAATLVAVLVVFLFLGLSASFFRDSPTRVVVSLFASIVLLAANACSAWSYILLSQGWGSYTSSKELHPGVFADFYIWHLIDMIPSFEVWETLGVPAPVKADGPVASLPVLVFRICVALPIFALAKRWYDISKERSGEAA